MRDDRRRYRHGSVLVSRFSQRGRRDVGDCGLRCRRYGLRSRRCGRRDVGGGSRPGLGRLRDRRGWRGRGIGRRSWLDDGSRRRRRTSLEHRRDLWRDRRGRRLQQRRCRGNVFGGGQFGAGDEVLDEHLAGLLAGSGGDQVDDGGRRLCLLNGDLDVEQEADRLLLDGVHHGGEHVEAFALVLHQRVALTHGAQTDSLLQIVHFVEVLAPFTVHHRKQDAPLQLAHHRLTGRPNPQSLLTAVVGLLRICLEFLCEIVRGERAALGLDRFERDADRIQGRKRGPELLQVPVLREALAGFGQDITLDGFLDHRAHLFVQICSVEHLAPLVVNHGALAVHHFVVFQNVLADLEVLRLDLRLG